MIAPIPADVRAAYLAARTELARVMREFDRVQRAADKLRQPPKASKKRSAAHPITGGTRVPIWYQNQPDPALAAFGSVRGQSFVMTLKQDSQTSHERRSRPKTK